MSSKIQYYLI